MWPITSAHDQGRPAWITVAAASPLGRTSFAPPPLVHLSDSLTMFLSFSFFLFLFIFLFLSHREWLLWLGLIVILICNFICGWEWIVLIDVKLCIFLFVNEVCWVSWVMSLYELFIVCVMVYVHYLLLGARWHVLTYFLKTSCLLYKTKRVWKI